MSMLTSSSNTLVRGLSQSQMSSSTAYLSFLYPSTARLIHLHVASNGTSSHRSGHHSLQGTAASPSSSSSKITTTYNASYRSLTSSARSSKPNQTPPSLQHISSQSSSTPQTPPFTPRSSNPNASVDRKQHQDQRQGSSLLSFSPSASSTSSAVNQSTTTPSDEACASLSPSSPAAPRSQRSQLSSIVSPGGAQPAPSAPSQNVDSAVVPEQGQAPPPGPTSSGASAPKPKARPAASRGTKFMGKKAAITLTPEAVTRLQSLLTSPTGPRLIRIGVRNKGCAGMAYHLEYVKPEEAGKFDERVKQDGVEVLVDSKALFSIIGSEMDWKEDRLSAKFVFNNPNIKEACGCGESFLT